jgi:TonB family protein
MMRMMRNLFAGALLVAMAWVCAVAAQELKQVTEEQAAQHIIQRTEAKYPPLAEVAHIQGVVVLQVTINESGKVEDRKAISGHPLLVQPAMDAVKDWKFEPFLDNGKPVPVSTEIRFVFSLGPGAELRRDYLQQEVECTKQIFSKNFPGGELVCKKALETAVKLPKSFASDKMRAYGNAGEVAYSLRKFDEALEDFKQQCNFAQQALQPDNPQMVHVRGNLAHAYLSLGQLPQAEAEYTEIEKLLETAEAKLEARRDTMKPEAYAGVKASYTRNMKVVLQEHITLLRKMGKLDEANVLEQRASTLAER